MSTQERALTWSGKWHIVNQGHRSPATNRYLVGLCGAYLYDHNNDPRYPQKLRDIRAGLRKDTGLCKKCAQASKTIVVTVELPESSPQGDHEVFPVPLYDPYTGEVGDHLAYQGEVWIRPTDRKIATTSVPNPLITADDARRLAAALLAVADLHDRLYKEEGLPRL